LRGAGILEEEIIMQIGFSTYEPRYCKWKKFYTYEEMNDYVKQARVVITHGGPSSFIMPLQYGKVPIVVPREKRYGEHVNDHQKVFCLEVEKRKKNIIVIDDIKEIPKIINGVYNNDVRKMGILNSNNDNFNEAFKLIINKIFDV
jgi:UDP-N-acetylglucosamine transferase subunit ALG13